MGFTCGVTPAVETGPVKVFVLLSRYQRSPAVCVPKRFHLLSWLVFQWRSKLPIQQSSQKPGWLSLPWLGWAVVGVNLSQAQIRWLGDQPIYCMVRHRCNYAIYWLSYKANNFVDFNLKGLLVFRNLYLVTFLPKDGREAFSGVHEVVKYGCVHKMTRGSCWLSSEPSRIPCCGKTRKIP